jgi:hypothetical protein
MSAGLSPQSRVCSEAQGNNTFYKTPRNYQDLVERKEKTALLNKDINNFKRRTQDQHKSTNKLSRHDFDNYVSIDDTTMKRLK